MTQENKQYPKGHFIGMWMGIGIAIFAGTGVAIGTATENPGLMGIGPAIGLAFGLAIGQGIEKKHEQEGRIRPLTAAEEKRRKIMIYVGTGFLVIGVLVLLAFALLR